MLCGEWSDNYRYRQKRKWRPQRGLDTQVVVESEGTSKPVDIDGRLTSNNLGPMSGM